MLVPTGPSNTLRCAPGCDRGVNQQKGLPFCSLPALVRKQHNATFELVCRECHLIHHDGRQSTAHLHKEHHLGQEDETLAETRVSWSLEGLIGRQRSPGSAPGSQATSPTPSPVRPPTHRTPGHRSPPGFAELPQRTSPARPPPGFATLAGAEAIGSGAPPATASARGAAPDDPVQATTNSAGTGPGQVDPVSFSTLPEPTTPALQAGSRRSCAGPGRRLLLGPPPEDFAPLPPPLIRASPPLLRASLPSASSDAAEATSQGAPASAAAPDGVLMATARALPPGKLLP